MSSTHQPRRKLDAETIRRQAEGHWLAIFQDLCKGMFDDAIARLGQHVRCPFHGGERDFRFTKKGSKRGGNTADTGVAWCTCGKYVDGFAVLMRANGWSFYDALVEVDRWLNGDAPVQTRPVYTAPTPTVHDTSADDARKLSRVHKLFGAGKVFDPKVVTYYQERGISLQVLADVQGLRFLQSLGYYVPPEKPEGDPIKIGSFPAILAPMLDVKGELVAVHRTWLRPDGKDKAPVLKAKKLTETPGVSGAAARLFNANGSDILGLTEGIETGLAAHQLSRGRYWREFGPIPVWASYSAGNLEAVQIPQFLLTTLKTIVIFADNDEKGRGEEAAKNLQKRLADEHPELMVIIKMPEVMGWDWNDVLVNL